MPTQNLLYKKDLAINDYIRVRIPSVGEILEREDDYYGLVSMFTAMPIDMMVQLDDIGIDFSSINEYDLFVLLFGIIKERDTSLILGNLDLKTFDPAIDKKNGNIVFVSKETEAKIDRAIHGRIADILRKVNHIDKNIRQPANGDAKEYMIRRAREKMRRQKNRVNSSYLESLIIAMVNTEQFRYGFEEVRALSIYQFNESVRQIIQKIDYDNIMHGIYAGTVDVKNINQSDLNWIIHK